MEAVTAQYKLKAAGKVIQIGIEIRGMTRMNFANFRKFAFPPVVLVLRILSMDKTPPITGRIPVGSGLLRSLNQRMPSVRIAGLISKL